MTEDERQIRRLVEQWAAAVHTGDLDGVLADHAEDVVMFDVPPPREGVRGIAAYRDTWPDFFVWQRQGALFEITELAVTAGQDVAYAHALLRCATPEDLQRDPALRLRLTLGLVKRDGRWVVAHEHHSFPDTSGEDDAAGEREVRDLHQRWSAATRAKDLNGLMAAIADDVVSYEHEAPLRYRGVDAVQEVCATGLEAGGETVDWTVPDLEVLVRGDLAVGWGLNRMVGSGTAVSWSRGTRVFRRRDGEWAMVHQHVSFPFHPDSGRVATDLQPEPAPEE